MRLRDPRVGIGLALAGVVLVVIGLVGFFTSGSSGSDTVAPAETPSAPATTTTSVAATPPPTTTSTTTIASTTTPATSTTTSTTTTTTSTTTTTTLTTTTTTTVPADRRVELFVEAYAAALVADDVDFLFDSLHPVVIDGYGADECRNWIQSEIILLGDYALTGPVDGPFEQPFTTPSGTGTIPDAYSAPIRFSFKGQDFESTGGFADVDGQIRWLGQCT